MTWKNDDPITADVRRLSMEGALRRKAAHQQVIAEIARQAGVDLAAIDREADRRRRVEKRRIDKERQALAAACTARLIERRDVAEGRLRRYLASRRKVLRSLLGNPTLIAETPVRGSTFVELDAPDPGMMGGGVPPVPPHAYANGRFEIDEARPGHNYLRFAVDVENGDWQHRHIRASIRAGLTFEIAPPERGWFWVQRVWLPVWGFGEYRWHAGDPSCWGQLTPMMFVQTGGLLSGRSIRVDALLEQERPGAATEVCRIGPDTYGCYSFGAGRHGTANPDPYRADYWGMGVIELDDPFAGRHDTDIVLRGRSNAGGTVRVRLLLTCAVNSYYKHEDHRIAFDGEGYIMLPFVKLEGRAIA
jgi:hypothetical protein